MLPKKNRAGKKAVEKIFKDGIFIDSNNLNLKYILENNATPPQISFIVPKTIEKKAVRRNYLRRCGYIILKKYFNKIPNGFLGVFIFKKYQNNILTLENEIKIILNKIY
ncbi:MAG: ribonuclease P protein component [Patescibacteria group bacterium]